MKMKEAEDMKKKKIKECFKIIHSVLNGGR